MLEQVKNAKAATVILSALSTDGKNNLLTDIAQNLRANSHKILAANLKDQEFAKTLLAENKISQAIFDRLVLDDGKIKKLETYCEAVKKLEDPVGVAVYKVLLDKNLELTKTTEPFGVIATVFESRPEVVVQVAVLALKSGNAVILKGGSECQNTNACLGEIIKNTLEKYKLADALVLLESRDQITEILGMDRYIDLIIPRGSNEFVRYIQENTKILVMGHSAGVCHIYVAKDANLESALSLVLDAKTDYPAACNAVETLLLDSKIATPFLTDFLALAVDKGITIKGDDRVQTISQETGYQVESAAGDWMREYSDLILAVRVVDGLNAAINHINEYGSKHTDAIITEDAQEAAEFLRRVDSACVFHNASTRFADGYVFGLGAEVGISTGKHHARGPVGLDGLVTTKWRLVGEGQKCGDYGAPPKKPYIHQRLLV